LAAKIFLEFSSFSKLFMILFKFYAFLPLMTFFHIFPQFFNFLKKEQKKTNYLAEGSKYIEKIRIVEAF